MKKLLSAIFVLAVIFVANANRPAECVSCMSSTTECYRVIVGNTTDIYHGVKGSCD